MAALDIRFNMFLSLREPEIALDKGLLFWRLSLLSVICFEVFKFELAPAADVKSFETVTIRPNGLIVRVRKR